MSFEREYIIGKKIGGCTILSEYPSEYTAKKKLKRKVKCKCNHCDNIFDIYYRSLCNRKKDRCYCQNERFLPKNYPKNIIGKKVGGCSILSEYPREYNAKGKLKRRVKCKCNHCDNIFDIYYNSLIIRKKNKCYCKKEVRDIPIGTRFGKLVIVEKFPRIIGTSNRYRCTCDCGNQNHITNINALMKNNPKSCGCDRGIIHNLSHHPLYNSWSSFLGRHKANKVKFIDYYNHVISLGYTEGDTVFIKDHNCKNIIGNVEVASNSNKSYHLSRKEKDKFSSNFKGVFFNKRRGKFTSSITATISKSNQKTLKTHHAGYFTDEIDALRARNRLILERELSIYALQSPYKYRLFDNGKKISYSLPIEQYDLIQEDIDNKMPINNIIRKYDL